MLHSRGSRKLTLTRRKIGKISIDDRSGDFVEYSGPLEINLRTLFHFRKPLPPRIDPCSIKQVVPPQPAPSNATGYLASWVWGGAPLTGAQLDAIGTYLSILGSPGAFVGFGNGDGGSTVPNPRPGAAIMPRLAARSTA